MTRRKPGPGWHHVAGAVWDHTSGIRLHIYGLLKLPGGRMMWATQWPESRRADELIRIAGGNRRRGLMMWALEMERTP